MYPYTLRALNYKQQQLILADQAEMMWGSSQSSGRAREAGLRLSFWGQGLKLCCRSDPVRHLLARPSPRAWIGCQELTFHCNSASTDTPSQELILQQLVPRKTDASVTTTLVSTWVPGITSFCQFIISDSPVAWVHLWGSIFADFIL